MLTNNNDAPNGVSPKRVIERSPNGYEYFITGASSNEILVEFKDISSYLDYCSKLGLGERQYFNFHPDPFK